MSMATQAAARLAAFFPPSDPKAICHHCDREAGDHQFPNYACPVKPWTEGGDRFHTWHRFKSKDAAAVEALARRIGREVGDRIKGAPRVTSHPYERQWVLEELIRVLQAAV